MSSDAITASRVKAQRAAPRRGGLWRDALRRLAHNGPALVGAGITLVVILAAVLAPLLTSFDPDQVILADRLEHPSSAHWFGTDLLGRDEFARVLYGARLSIRVAVLAVAMGLGMGGLIGAIAGTLGGKLDAVLMRVIDVLLSIPGILLAIGIVTWLGQGLTQIMFAVGLALTPLFARLLRASLLELGEADFVLAARSLGASRFRVFAGHMLPNALTQLIAAATVTMATAIIDVAALGFLGLGPADPRTPEWGAMLTDATVYLRSAPWLLIFPAAAIVIVTISFNLLGDGLRESLDPRLRR